MTLETGFVTWICPRTPHHLGTGLGGLLKTWGVGCIPGEQHNHQVEFTADRLATYLLTQNTVVERGVETRTIPREKRSGGRVGRLSRAGREGSLLDKISNEVLEASGSRRYEEKSAQWKELTPDEEVARTHPRNGEIEISPKRRWRSNCDEVPDGRFSGDKTCLTNTSTSSQGRSSRSWLA